MFSSLNSSSHATVRRTTCSISSRDSKRNFSTISGAAIFSTVAMSKLPDICISSICSLYICRPVSSTMENGRGASQIAASASRSATSTTRSSCAFVFSFCIVKSFSFASSMEVAPSTILSAMSSVGAGTSLSNSSLIVTVKSAVTPLMNSCGQSVGMVIGNVFVPPVFMPISPSTKPGRFIFAAPVSRENFSCLMPSMGNRVCWSTASKLITTWSPTSSPRSTTTRMVPRLRSWLLNCEVASISSLMSSPGATTVTASLR
mmetsp:Transcript_15933/g.52290  ORF Transcript_15933/g.52290 Transcript_15933/m.52290 type:complete len:260 (-) Transcript_15933:516-1295(-)